MTDEEIYNLVDKVLYNNPTQLVEKKFNALKKVNNPKIDNFFKERLSEIYIQASSLYDILKHNDANGNCYIATDAIILNLNSQDMVVRGDLLPEHPKGWKHSWIEFLFENEWYVLDTTFVGVYIRADYYQYLSPNIIKKTSNSKILEDDFAQKHLQIIKIRNQSWDLNLFLYYEKDEYCGTKPYNEVKEIVYNDLYNNIEVDEQGKVLSYKTPYMWI